MAIDVKVPALGESISSGILASWHVQDGDYVQKDQIIYELETDKITSEGLAETAGVIALKVQEGDEVEIGHIVAEIDDTASAPEAEEKTEPAPATEPTLPEKEVPAPAETPSEPVAKAESLPRAEAATAPSPAKPVDSSVRATRKRMSPLRAKIAERLVAAQQDAAMLTTFNEVDLSAVKALRSSYQDAFVQKHGIKLGFMSFFVKAVVNALRDTPGLNAQVDGDEIVQNHYYDIGIAVSTEKGLMVPVVRNCDTLSLAEIEQEIATYAAKARDGKITIDDLQGGVFTITNGGVFGSLLSTPILNAPQSGILGMHTIQERPVAIDGEIVIRPMMYLALSYDHRIVDGKEAVSFLLHVKNAIENPSRLLIEV